MADPACTPSLKLDPVHTGGAVFGQLDCQDPSETGLSYAPGDAAHGQVVADGAGGVTYEADADYAGPDAFDVEVTDNDGGATTVHVTVQVTDEAPSCDPLDLGDTPHGRATGNDANCSDPESDQLSYTVSDPPHGTASVDAFGFVSYTPDAGAEGPDSFTLRASDG